MVRTTGSEAEPFQEKLGTRLRFPTACLSPSLGCVCKARCALYMSLCGPGGGVQSGSQGSEQRGDCPSHPGPPGHSSSSRREWVFLISELRNGPLPRTPQGCLGRVNAGGRWATTLCARPGAAHAPWTALCNDLYYE